MAQYRIGDIFDVFWASNDGFKTGRDPMGVQNSSIATYSRLLPGLTNLTGHIRYYSIYCWLIDVYLKMHESGDIDLHQYNFIRRAELIMAFIMKGSNVGAVIGSNFAANVKCERDEDILAIGKGADYQKNSKDLYWSFQSGALGQYYLGSLIYFKLVKVVGKGFTLETKGEDLANAFRLSVPQDVRSLFIKCITEGVASVTEIKYLRPLGLDSIILFSDEWHALNDMITSADNTPAGSSSLRRDTIYFMLDDIRNGLNVGDFVARRFNSCEIERHIKASFGWIFYYLCEVLHYCIESILCLLLNNMDEMHNPSVSALLKKTVEDILGHLDQVCRYDTVDEWKAYCNQDIMLEYRELKNKIKRRNYAHAVAIAIPLLLRLQNEVEARKDDVYEFEARHELVRQRGILSVCLKDYVLRYLRFKPNLYIETLLHQVMNEHTCVAIGKMGTDNKDLRKFILEDGCAVLVEIRYPTETNPRISSLYNFLEDLKYFDADNGVADKFMETYG